VNVPAEHSWKRVVIENVRPRVDEGRFPIKRVVGETVDVLAEIFTDGHDSIRGRLLFRKEGEADWRETGMAPLGNDEWQGSFTIEDMRTYHYTVQGWVDPFATWREGLKKKHRAGQNVEIDLRVGADLVLSASRRLPAGERPVLEEAAAAILSEKSPERAVSLALSDALAGRMELVRDDDLTTTFEKVFAVSVDRPKALFSAWYEIFPRSCPPQDKKAAGTFESCKSLLPDIAAMGFDVLYLPPIHPIGKTQRKGKDNAAQATPRDPGSPWAIGSEEGGHKAVHPGLGTLDDLRSFVAEAGRNGLEVALDLALQCSPDHPYLKERSEWFIWRPDGTVQFAENPPKKYEDIVPFDFATARWRELWEEMKSIVLFWVEQGVRIFRVDNPHTKPFEFWEWLIGEVRQGHPDVIFLAEAFTRPKVMRRLAKAGFSQSYTYFTWRNTKHELTEYLTELTATDLAEFMRPNFWPNTPDILPEYLQVGGKQAFAARLILAATLSSNYGIYGPAFELCAAEAVPGKEEYKDSEKYEIKRWDWDKRGSLRALIKRVNRIRRENAALQQTRNLTFLDIENDQMIAYLKESGDRSSLIVTVVNLDPFRTQAGRLRIPIDRLGIGPRQSYLVHDLLSDDKFIWQDDWNGIELDPGLLPAHIFRVQPRVRRESDFDYYM
jgi:starch synthase (maltosyl-transferring)